MAGAKGSFSIDGEYFDYMTSWTWADFIQVEGPERFSIVDGKPCLDGKVIYHNGVACSADAYISDYGEPMFGIEFTTTPPESSSSGHPAYIGIGGTARKVKGIYIGVDGVARRVKKAYIGVDGVARLCYSEDTSVGG